jgi:hypothetical protein
MVSCTSPPNRLLVSNDETDDLIVHSDVIKPDTTSETITDATPFSRPKSLMINASGIRAFRLPLPSSQLEIPIFHPDGSLAYTSNRNKRSSGDAILSHSHLGDLISTSYFFGPGRAPVVRSLAPSGSSDEIKICGRWTSRAQTFVSSAGMTLEWSYISERSSSREKTLLVLCEKGNDRSTQRGRRIAKLVRSDETRPTESTWSYAGNGGELVIDRDACKGVDEALIVATCLVMLKKEIDRRRSLRMLVLSVALSGGS